MAMMLLILSPEGNTAETVDHRLGPLLCSVSRHTHLLALAANAAAPAAAAAALPPPAPAVTGFSPPIPSSVLLCKGPDHSSLQPHFLAGLQPLRIS